MPSSSSMASSTEHCTSTPGEPTAAPIETATAFEAASASTGTVVSISRKPKAAAVAASAASSKRVVGAVRHVRLVGRRAPGPQLGHRHRQLDRSQQRPARGPASRASSRRRGGRPRRGRPRGPPSSGPRRRSSIAIASAATPRSRPWAAMNASMVSKSSRARPSSSRTSPSGETTRDGAGSAGESKAIRPRDGVLDGEAVQVDPLGVHEPEPADPVPALTGSPPRAGHGHARRLGRGLRSGQSARHRRPGTPGLPARPRRRPPRRRRPRPGLLCHR